MEVPPEPTIFLKPPSSLLASGDAIVYPRLTERLDYEGEFGVVIGRRARNREKLRRIGLHPGLHAASTMSPRAICNARTASGRAAKDSIRFARLGPASSRATK